MTYDVQTPQEYLAQLETDWQKEKLQNLRAIIIEKAPEIQEFIQYKMLAYGNKKSIAFHLNAQRNYVSLYVGNVEKIEGHKELLEGLNIGKGCIRFKKSIAIADTKIDEFIAKTIERWNANLDIAC